jgi:hypothetical protein
MNTLLENIRDRKIYFICLNVNNVFMQILRLLKNMAIHATDR